MWEQLLNMDCKPPYLQGVADDDDLSIWWRWWKICTVACQYFEQTYHILHKHLCYIQWTAVDLSEHSSSASDFAWIDNKQYLNKSSDKA